MSAAKHEVAPEQLRKRTDPTQFPFETTADVSPLEEIIGQERAVRAIRFGLDIQSPGYNVFVAGLSGTGKGSIVRRFLTKLSADEPVPDDVLYVHNFEDPDSPRALFVPAGTGHRLRGSLAELIEDLQEQVAHPRMCLLQLVEEHHREGVGANAGDEESTALGAATV